MIRDEEDLEPDLGLLSFYIEAFRELSSCRVNSMSLGPIPFTSIVEYSRIFDVGDFEEFLYFIRVMDTKVIELENKKNKSKQNNSKKPTKKKG